MKSLDKKLPNDENQEHLEELTTLSQESISSNEGAIAFKRPADEGSNIKKFVHFY